MNDLRRNVTDDILSQLKGKIPEEEYKRFKTELDVMPDELFFYMMEEAMKLNSSFDDMVPLKDILNSELNKNTKDVDDVEFMTGEEVSSIMDAIKKTKPTDIVELNEGSIESLLSLVKNEKSSVPSDIIFIDSIPLPDMYIAIKCPEGVLKFRVVIYPDYKQRLRLSNQIYSTKVGCMIIEGIGGFKESEIFLELGIVPGFDYFVTSNRVGTRKIPSYVKEDIEYFTCGIFKLFSSNLAIWYAIQISLLHPTVKEIFAHPTQGVIKENTTKYSSKKGNKKKHKIKYIKRHIINAEDITKRHNSSYNRKALYWYVTGHWRHYQNGKKTFIKPYWKGIMREAHNNPTPREREIVLPDKE